MVISFAFLLISLSSNSQELINNAEPNNHYPKKLISKIEFLVGPCIIYPNGSKGLEDSRVGKFGFAANVGLIHVINSRFAINLKFGYESKGYKLIINGFYNPQEAYQGIIDITLNYATVSILPRYSFFKERQFYFGLGPYFGYLLCEKDYSELSVNGLLVAQSSSSPDPHLLYKEADMGIRTMVGYDIHINQKKDCSLQFLYNLGLVDVTKNGTFPVKNSTFSLLLGISINKSNYMKP